MVIATLHNIFRAQELDQVGGGSIPGYLPSSP